METTPEQQSPPSAHPFGQERPKELTYQPSRALPQARRSHAVGRTHRLHALATWISIGFGAWQLLAPRAFARTVGMTLPDWLIRTVGARDLGLGIGMLAQPESSGWRWARAASDVFDTGLIGASFCMRRTDKARLVTFAGVAASVIALDMRVAAAQGMAARRASAAVAPAKKSY